MAPRVEALVKPELLVWARESAGYALADAAHKAKVKPEKLESWESGATRPTIPQLRELARVYKRPLAVFFLATPPKDFQPMHDFRRLPDTVTEQSSPALRFEVRRAYYRRDVALELYQEIGETPPTLGISASIHDNPEELAVRLRQNLGISYEGQIQWKGEYDALNHWRAALEKVGVLIFQASGISLEEMRGFSISDLPLPVICINSKDSPHARIFTILHEFTHIVLQRGGLCDLEEQDGGRSEDQRVEVFCNRVAGAIMVPQEQLLREQLVLANTGRVDLSDQDLRQLVSRYNASREVILRRLLLLGRTTNAFYQRKRDEFQKQRAERGKAKKGFATIEQRTLASTGMLFANLVLSSYYQERITSNALSDLLEVKLGHMAKIERAVLGRTVEFGAAA